MIAFVHIHKTGGTTLKYILRRSFGSTHCDARIHPRPIRSTGIARDRVLSAKDLKGTKWIYPSLKSIAGHMVCSFSDLHTDPNLRYYTFLRDPVKRTLSRYKAYQRHHSIAPPIDEWLEMEHNRNAQTWRIAGKEDADVAIEIIKDRIEFVGLMEFYDESLIMLKTWIGDPQFDPRYQARNVAIKKESEWSAETIKAIEKANEEDQKVYDFVLKEIWPKQLDMLGTNLDEEVESLRKQNMTFKDSKPIGGSLSRGLYWLFLPAISRGKIFNH